MNIFVFLYKKLTSKQMNSVFKRLHLFIILGPSPKNFSLVMNKGFSIDLQVLPIQALGQLMRDTFSVGDIILELEQCFSEPDLDYNGLGM